MGIRGRLLLGYFAVIVILIASGVLIVARMRRAMKATVGRDAQTVAASLMGEVGQAVRDRIQAIRIFAWTSTHVVTGLAESNRAFDALGSPAAIEAEIRARDEAWRATAKERDSPFMRGILENELSMRIRDAMEQHRKAEGGRPVFAELFATNRYGANVGQSGRTTDYMQSDEEWWQEAWQRGIWIAPEVAFDESAGVHSLDIAVRVDSLDDRPLGVLKAVLRVRVLRDIIEAFASRSQLRRASIELLDRRGHVIHRQRDRAAFQADLSGERAVGLALAGERGAIVEQTARGELLRAFAGSRRVPGYPDLGWVLLLNHPTASVYKSVEDLERWMLAVGIIGSVLAIVVGVLLAQAFARITQRVEDAGESLRRSESRVRSIVAHVVDGIVTILPDGRIETVNPAFLRIFGYTEEALIGRNIDMLLPAPLGPEGDSSIRASLASREGVGLRKDGSEFPFDLAVGEIVDSKTPRFVAVVRDATERRKARHALQEAKDAAESASRSKGEFLANMSHDLRTPLNAIIGYTEMVAEELEERGEVDLVSDLGKVRTSGKNLLALINDILDVSKIEAGRLEVFVETFDFGAFLREVVSTVRPLVETNDNELQVDVSGAFGSVCTDQTKLRQVLLNLLSNAAKFTRSGQINLRVRRRRRQDEDWMEIGVADTGIGMTQEQLDHVWEAFAQADASTTREFGGTGLGLTITRSFCELLGGEIEVESAAGAGTTFTVHIPAGERASTTG